jgi:UrcA family protein
MKGRAGSPGPTKGESDMTKFFLASLLAFTATPALAEAPAIISTTVQTADLDLSSKAGQRALDRRLNQAVIEVCGVASMADLAGQNDVRSCQKETLVRLSADRDQRIAEASSKPIEVASR